MTARLVSVYRYFGKLVLVPFRYFSIDTYRNIDIFDNTTINQFWPIRSLKKFPVGGDNSACSDFISQNLQFRCLHDNTATGVFENLHPGRSFQKCSVSVT